MRTILASVAGLVGLISAPVSNAAPATGTPPMVNSYAVQQAALCNKVPGASPAPASADRADLNGDGLIDWIFDAGRQPCVASSHVAKEYGTLVTIFLATPEGDARPGLQRAAFGSHLERIAGKTRLVLTLAGQECGESLAKALCDRPVVWSIAENRLSLAPLTSTPKLAGN